MNYTNTGDIGKDIPKQLLADAPGWFIASASLAKAVVLLSISIYTLTTTKSPRTSQFIQLLLAGPAIYYFNDYGIGPVRGDSVAGNIGMSALGIYCTMRVIECIAIGLGILPIPRWKTVAGKVLPLPTTLAGRLAYTVDYLTSLRGSSWFKDVYWDFAPTNMIVSAPPEDHTKSEYLKDALPRILFNFIVMDVFDTINKSYPWDTSQTLTPLTSHLNIPLQVFFSFSLGVVATVLTLDTEYTFISILFVSLGSSPSSWPPLFDSVFSMTSLADMWSRRWHFGFRRTFFATSKVILHPFPNPKSLFAQRTLRIFVTFAVSALTHLFIMYGPPIDERHPHTFFDPSILSLFLVQPVGLLVESLVIAPLVQHLPMDLRVWAMRAWAWGFILWSGRWWCDVYVRRGCWDAEEEWAFQISVVRGVWKGNWFP